MSLVSKAKSRKPNTIIGIDCSTKSLAFSKWEAGEFVTCGEIFFEGRTFWQRLSFIHRAIPGLVDSGALRADAVVFEEAVNVGNNIKTALSLAYVYGACIGALGSRGIVVAKVAPMTWQAFIGNPNLKKVEKEAMQAEFPGKSKSWYLAKGREIRKGRTLKFARKYAKIESNSDNVGDAVGIGYYGVKNAHLLTFE